MDLEALRAQARAVATRMETRINTALGENRDMTADEEAAHTADLAELAELKGKITAAEQGGTADESADPNDPVAAAVAGERTRILSLADLCSSSVLATPLRTAIENGQDAGAFAIDIAKASKARGATIDQLRAGAVQPEQLPAGGKPGTSSASKPLTGRARGAAIAAKAASLGHSALSHLKQG